MCLVAIAWRAHPLYPLVLAGNRDEFHERPSAPAAWWEDAGHVLGGRDLVAGGSWLAVSRSGRIAVVINDPRRPPGPERTASRGALVRDFVAGDTPSGRFLDAVSVAEQRYAGFRLVVGSRVQLRAFVTSHAGAPRRWTLRPGVTVFSNSPLDMPWPKVAYLESALSGLAASPGLERQMLFALLARREPVDGEGDGHPAGRTPFVVGAHYGTRASTVILMGSDGRCAFEERRFDAAGQQTGETREEFALG